MNDTQRIEWLAERAAAMFGVDTATAAAAARDSARLGTCFKLALASGMAPGDAMRAAIEQADGMQRIPARSVR